MSNTPVGDCATAELHLINRVQSFGGLVAIDKRTKRVFACSANIQKFIDRRPEALLGQDWSVAFRAEQVPSLFKPSDTAGRHFAHIQKAELNGHILLIASHSVGDSTLVEMEAHEAERQRFDVEDRADYLDALGATHTPESAAILLMESVARISQYDRVMLYKFLPDWHGEVIAERLQPGVHGYLGLRFPASDIPANARRLFLVNWQRVIADVRADTVAVVTLPDSGPIDFTFSQLRSVHPVHIEYLKNIGAEASFSVSVIVAGKLWGLVACHNLASKTVAMNHRALCEELARMTGIHMSDLADLHVAEQRAGLREGLAAILGALRSRDGKKRDVVAQLKPLREVFRAQAILAHLDDQDFHSGVMPDEISLGALRAWAENCGRFAVRVSRTIEPALADYPELVRFASGTLYIPLSGGDFLLLMRPEQIETVNWAGRPRGLGAPGEAVAELTPRASFEKWTQQVRGSADAWEEAEIESAAKLRDLLIDYIEKVHLENAALHDPLTGLANRTMFEAALDEAIKLAIKDNMLAVVFMLDLDQFKPVNDTLGHAAGDELLIEVGHRLTGLLRSRDMVARLGGDEFGIVQFDVQRREDADRTAQRMIQDIRRPFLIQGQPVEIGLSIGMSVCPTHAVERRELVECADLALFESKRTGRNTFNTFTDGMRADSRQHDSVRNGLIGAMRDNSFSLVYQPIVNAKTKALHSFETFARWNRPAKGQLTARDFLPLIEECQLLTQFADWGIRRVMQQVKAWSAKALPPVPVSLNLTARQFLSLDLAGLCQTLARECDVGLDWLRFDLEQSALQIDVPRTVEKITSLARLGIGVNIDHFGQGLVPLNRIADLKINQLKVVGKYFADTPGPNGNDALIAMIVEVGRVLHVPIVATQIETETMALRAASAGIDCLQGNQISRALEPDAAEQRVREERGRPMVHDGP